MYEPLETPLRDHLTADLPMVADFSDLDGSTYHELRLIIKRTEDGHAGIYCLTRDWRQTLACTLADERTLNASYQEQIELLDTRLIQTQRLAQAATDISAENDALRVAIARLQAEIKRLTDPAASTDPDQAERTKSSYIHLNGR